jgi:hypothetical protein
MKSFKEFLSDTEQSNPVANSEPKKWSATKSEIVSYWRNLRPDLPVLMRSIPYTHQGSTYGEDGIRITGSPKFIGSVLARLKEILNYESTETKLSVAYRQTASPSKAAEGDTKTSYVFYVNSKQRGDKNPNTL